MVLKGKGSPKKRIGQDYWQSYSDMMAALLLMFILIMACTLYFSLSDFERKNAELDEQQAVIEEQETVLTTREAELEETKEQLADLSRLVGVKSEIVEALDAEFKDSDLHIQVDGNTGAITFDSSILFAYDSSTVSSEGKAFLKEFVPRYISVLLGDEYKSYIAEIIIEGHTDPQGEYMYNLNLSQDRAYAVAQYCLGTANTSLGTDQIQTLRGIVTANGRSYSDPVYDENGNVDYEASRRVVFKFRLKDEEMIEAMQELLEGSLD